MNVGISLQVRVIHHCMMFIINGHNIIIGKCVLFPKNNFVNCPNGINFAKYYFVNVNSINLLLLTSHNKITIKLKISIQIEDGALKSLLMKIL